jgi:hypothetical protein
MPTFDSLTLALPAHWLPTLINGDTTHLDDEEYAQLARWELDMLNEFGPLMFELPEDAETHFARYHDAAEYGVLACDCYDIEVWFHAETEAAA